jgi:predicted patatin/cPLA2 family phospholipase
VNAGVRALVVQGGGMRGIYSAGAMSALADAGLADSFDHIFASSSGAINGAYLMSGQTDLVAAGYADHLNRNSPFIRYWRLNKIVDIDYLVDSILRHAEFPLDVKAVIDSPAILHIVVTDLHTADAIEITSKDVGNWDAGGDLLYEVLRATSALPLFYGRAVDIRGRKFVDGGISDAIPLFRAIEAGCTDITVVTTRNPRFRRTQKRGIGRVLGLTALAGHPVNLRRKLLNEDRLFNKTMDLLQDSSELPEKIRITLVSPSDESRLAGRTTRGRDKLWDCAQMAREDVFRVLGVSVS